MKITIQNETYDMSQTNPYGYQWFVYSERYGEEGPTGMGDTKLEAFIDYIDFIIDDLTDEQYKLMKKEAESTLKD